MQRIKDWFAKIDVAVWLGTLVRYVLAGVKAVWNSFKAFVGSPKVWLAAGIFALAGYWGGYLVVAGNLASVDATNRVLASDKAALESTVTDLREQMRKLAEPAKPVAPVALVAQPVPAESQPLATPVTKPRKVKAAPPAPSFWSSVFQ